MKGTAPVVTLANFGLEILPMGGDYAPLLIRPWMWPAPPSLRSLAGRAPPVAGSWNWRSERRGQTTALADIQETAGLALIQAAAGTPCGGTTLTADTAVQQPPG